MKLSEAILLGSGLVVENRLSFGTKVDDTWYGCAVTMAVVAIGETPNPYVGSYLLQHYWPWTEQESIALLGHPISLEISDRHYQGESIKNIATWVASIEPNNDTKEVENETERSYITG